MSLGDYQAREKQLLSYPIHQSNVVPSEKFSRLKKEEEEEEETNKKKAAAARRRKALEAYVEIRRTNASVVRRSLCLRIERCRY